jgi:DNA modification methylase
MVTDPPFGVSFDAGRRALVLGRPRVPRSVLNDDRADWREAYALFPGDVAYVYCSKLKSDIVIVSLEAVGLVRRDFLISVKPHFVLGRADYQSQYESCWYVVRRGKKARWQQKARNKSDVWMITLSNADDGRDERTGHGAQKPLECMLRPIEDNSERGDAVYDPFVGSGTTIIAAEIVGRRCYGMDLDPICCTEVIERWQNFAGRKAVLAETGQTFEEVKAERLGTDHHPQETPSQAFTR